MNTLQLEAMDRNCELPEVIFGNERPAPGVLESMNLPHVSPMSLSIRTAPTPQEPSSISGQAFECQHSKDVGMWPEHRCVGKCQYASEDAPEFLVRKARAALNVDEDQEISIGVVAWITDSPEEGSVNVHQFGSFLTKTSEAAP